MLARILRVDQARPTLESAEQSERQCAVLSPLEPEQNPLEQYSDDADEFARAGAESARTLLG